MVLFVQIFNNNLVKGLSEKVENEVETKNVLIC